MGVYCNKLELILVVSSVYFSFGHCLNDWKVKETIMLGTKRQIVNKHFLSYDYKILCVVK